MSYCKPIGSYQQPQWFRSNGHCSGLADMPEKKNLSTTIFLCPSLLPPLSPLSFSLFLCLSCLSIPLSLSLLISFFPLYFFFLLASYIIYILIPYSFFIIVHIFTYIFTHIYVYVYMHIYTYVIVCVCACLIPCLGFISLQCTTLRGCLCLIFQLWLRHIKPNSLWTVDTLVCLFEF